MATLTNTGRTVQIGDQVELVDYGNALLRVSDRPNQAWSPFTGNEHATLQAAGNFTTTRTWVPVYPNYSAPGVEITLTVATAPGSETLAVHLDHYDLASAAYVAAESFGLISATGTYLLRTHAPLTQLWQLRLVPSASGTWNVGAGYHYIQGPSPALYSPAGASVDGKTADITGTSDTAIIAAQGAGVRTYLTHLLVQNSHASVNTWVNIKDGSTVRYTVYAPAVGGGASIPLAKPLRGSPNTAWNAICETSGANVRVSASGYTSQS